MLRFPLPCIPLLHFCIFLKEFYLPLLQALIDYIKSDMDISVYWKTLNENGITKERLLSYDRAIHSEPNFRRDQKDGLLRDLGNYMRTLKAVHSGADLESAISNCMGYRAEVIKGI